jgi:hypothetical protein
MTAVRICRKLESETLHLPELKPFIGKTVEITVEEKAVDDPGCFSELTPPKAPSEKEREDLRSLLTAAQFEALMDVASEGGPDVEAIARLRFRSMT